MLSGYCGAFYTDRGTFCAEFVRDPLRFTTWEEFASARRHSRKRIGDPGPTPDLGGFSASAITRAG
jgi:hypothetical protein